MASGQPNLDLAVIILAAGRSKRFRSAVPKALHRAAGAPLIRWVLEAVRGIDRVGPLLVVVGHGAEPIVEAVKAECPHAVFVEQTEPLGTGDAVSRCKGALEDVEGDVLVLPGDAPLLRARTLSALVVEHRKAGAPVTLLTALLPDPKGYGRVVRDAGSPRVVEEADADDVVRQIHEVSTGIWCFQKDSLFWALRKVTADNAQGEIYLPDAAVVIVSEGGRIHTVMVGDPSEVRGVNDRSQLAEAGLELRLRRLREMMAAGVTIEDPATAYVEQGVEVGADTIIRPLTFLEGATRIGRGCLIGPSTRIVDSTVGDEAEVTFAVVRSSEIGTQAQVGPFASLRPGTVVGTGAKVGTFVEVKASVIGDGSKVPHLSYVGDAEIGTGVNLGAGTVTCNYDAETGVKSKTVVEDGALVSSGTMLVAPVKLGRGAVTGAGSVVTRDVEAGDVVVGVPARRLRERKPRSSGEDRQASADPRDAEEAGPRRPSSAG